MHQRKDRTSSQTNQHVGRSTETRGRRKEMYDLTDLLSIDGRVSQPLVSADFFFFFLLRHTVNELSVRTSRSQR